MFPARHLKSSLRLLYTIAGVTLLSSQACSQEQGRHRRYAAFLNIGVHLGYRWGENQGLVLGAEVSESRWQEGLIYRGWAVSLDRCREVISVHLAYEVGSFLGASLGPVISHTPEKGFDFGPDLMLYGGVIIIPYYRFSLLFFSGKRNEFGGLLKIPLTIKGGRVFGD